MLVTHATGLDDQFQRMTNSACFHQFVTIDRYGRLDVRAPIIYILTCTRLHTNQDLCVFHLVHLFESRLLGSMPLVPPLVGLPVAVFVRRGECACPSPEASRQ
jgi:hypothetical protein